MTMMASDPSAYLSWHVLWPCLACCERLWVRSPARAVRLPPIANRHLQIPKLAIFGPCVALIAWMPTVVSLATLVSRYPLRPLWRRRPIWLRNFAADHLVPLDSSSLLEVVGQSMEKSWVPSTVFLMANSAVGLVLSTSAALYPKAGPLFLTPLITHVRPALSTCAWSDKLR